MSYRVHKSDDGRRIAVFGKNDDFVASLVNGEWVADLPFDAHQLEELLLVDDAGESAVIVKEAKAALEPKKVVA